MNRSGLLLVALLGAATAPGSAHADNALRPEKIPAKAKDLATRGRIYHDAGDYQAAIVLREQVTCWTQ